MSGRLVVLLAGIGAIIVLLVTAFTASGAPSAPTATISATPNPSQAQTLVVTLQTQLYSFQPPNSIDLLGTQFLYTVNVTTASGGTNTVASNQKVAASVVSQSGQLFTLTATVSVSVGALCSTSCGSFIDNITVTAQSLSPTYPKFWSSPTSVIVFSNAAVFDKGPTNPPVSYGSFALEFYVPITAALAVGFVMAAVYRPSTWPVGVVLWGLVIGELVSWWGH